MPIWSHSRSFRTPIPACLCLLLLAFVPFAHAQAKADPFADLRLYHGAWTVTAQDASGTHTDHLRNQCTAMDAYYACQQTLNGKAIALVVFVPAGPGQFGVNNILPDGQATGRTRLTITGSRWVYASQSTANGHTTYYQTINTITSPASIHFVSRQSDDGHTWKVNLSGDEQRDPVRAAP